MRNVVSLPCILVVAGLLLAWGSDGAARVVAQSQGPGAEAVGAISDTLSAPRDGSRASTQSPSSDSSRLATRSGSSISTRPKDASTPRTAPQSVRVDSDADGVPDRIGETVTLAGRATVESGVIFGRRIFLQHRGIGIAVVIPRGGPTVVRGDSVRVEGVVEQDYGLTQVRAASYTVLDVPPDIPEPTRVSVVEAVGERFEGSLVRVEGRIVNRGSNEGGQYLLLNAPGGGDVLTVFVENRRLGAFELDEFETGDHVATTGILMQHDYTSPYTGYYELIPRTSEDLARVGLPSRYYRNALLAIGVVFLLAVGVVALLRQQVAQRTEELADSQARFQRLAEATFEGIVIHDDGRILDVNQALTEMVGYDRDDLLGENALEFVSDDTRHVVARHIEEDSEESYECTIVRKDGTTFPADIQARIVENDGRRLRISAVRDATQRKKNEAQLRHAKEEAEKVARLKSSLLNNMSHELRTPITSIIGYAELIIEEPPSMHDEFAARIRRSGRRLSDTLRSVLEMAQIEAGTLEMEVRTVDVSEVAREVAGAHEPMAVDKGVTLTVEANGTPQISTDRILCYRILTNLVHNAIKFTDAGEVVVRVETTPGGARYVVSDTGIGIGSSFLPHLFDAFKQESVGRTRTHDGTGLGLAITRRMVDLLGGTIAVESVKGEGSRFTVDIPPVTPNESVRVPG